MLLFPSHDNDCCRCEWPVCCYYSKTPIGCRDLHDENKRAVMFWSLKELDWLWRIRNRKRYITNRKKNTVEVGASGHTISSKPAIKYMNTIIDANWTFLLQKYCRMSGNTVGSYLWPKQCNPFYFTHHLCGREALKNSQRRKQMTPIYRLMRVCSAFKTTSVEAVLVVAGMIPVGLSGEDWLSDTMRNIWRTHRTQEFRRIGVVWSLETQIWWVYLEWLDAHVHS